MSNLNYKLIKRDKLSLLEGKVETLEIQIDAAKNFIKEIEKGNLSIDLKVNVNDDTDSLAFSLLNMRDQMQKIAEEEKQRNWVTEGLARFVDILRTKNDDLKELADTIISSTIKYMDANQGALYVINDTNMADVHLELIACYAYNRKKHLAQTIGLGDGLAGQAVLEKATIYMTDIPGDYLKITSGLGESLPRNLLIVPLILNDNVYGVLEMASFNNFKNHHREFIERLAESIASTISNVRINQNTRKLLSETQLQAEQMRSQEEEMRQNNEELSATQEEMQRILQEAQRSEKDIAELINVSADSIVTIDKHFRVVRFNKAFFASFDGIRQNVGKGFDILDIFKKEDHKGKIELYERVFAGESIEILDSLITDASTNYFLVRHSPLKNANGVIESIAIFAKDVTELILSKEKSDVLAQESQQRNEELKAQEEELRQNMEELQATQESMIKKQEEIEKGRAENERIKQQEAERAFKVGEMQKQTLLTASLKLREKVTELQKIKSEMEKVKEEEAQRAKSVAEMQKQTVNKLVLKLKAAEEEIRSFKSSTITNNRSS
jgi:GAF domain-containing protein